MNLQRLNDIYNNKVAIENIDVDSLNQLCRDYPYYRLPFVVLAKHYYQTGHYRFEEVLRNAAMRVKDRKVLYDYIHGINREIPAIADLAYQVEATQTIEEINHTIEEVYIKTKDEITQTKPSISEFLSDLELQNNKDSLVEIDEEVDEKIDETSYKAIELSEENVTIFEEEIQIPETEQEHESSFLAALSEQHSAEEVQLATDEKPIEFEFQGKVYENDFETTPNEFDEDIIGEEIATEFSFSRHIAEDSPLEEFVEENILEVEESNSEMLQEESIEIASELEEKIEPRSEELDSILRKYPVYQIESLLTKDKHENKSEDNVVSPEKDFFAWLNAPKDSHIKVEPEVSHEAIEQDKKETVIEDPSTQETHRSMDLIERFIAVNPQISRPKKEFFNPENMAKRSEHIDLEFVSETLANIYYEQGNYEMALSAYEKLSLQNPAKQAYFASLIEKIKQERK